MIPYIALLVIITVHYIADFRWQTHQQASNKSKSNKALLAHVATYTAGLFLASAALTSDLKLALFWVFYNGITHFCVDYVTSRASSRRWVKQEWHDFFAVVGFDQWLHYFTLFTSYVTIFT